MKDGELVRALRALADPTRFRMVQKIAAARELSCGQLAESFDVSQPTISHHLKVLADAEILLRRSEGKHHYTAVNRPLLKRVIALLPTRLAPAARADTAKKSRSKSKGDKRGKDNVK